MNAKELNKLRQVSNKKYIVYRYPSGAEILYLLVENSICYWRTNKNKATKLSSEDCKTYYNKLMQWGYNPRYITYEQ